MATSVDLTNRALSVIGTRSTIASMNEDSTEAQAASLHYEACVKVLLRLALWSFARKLAAGALLAASGGTPENPAGTAPVPLVLTAPPGSVPQAVTAWQYEYAWPQDCLRLRQALPALQAFGGAGSVPFWPGVTEASLWVPDYVGMTNSISYQIALDQDQGGNPIKVILTNARNALLLYTAYVPNENLWDDEFSEAFVFLLASHLVGSLIGDKQMDKMLYEKAANAAMAARAVDANEQPVSPNHMPDWIRVRNGVFSRPDDGAWPWGL